MPPTVPQFNLVADWWLPGNSTSNPPDIAGYNIQLYYKHWTDNFTPVSSPYAIIRVDKSFWSNIGLPIFNSIWRVQDPYLFYWYYRVRFWDYIHWGFPNMYIEQYCDQCDKTGVNPDSNR